MLKHTQYNKNWIKKLKLYNKKFIKGNKTNFFLKKIFHPN